MRKLLISAVLAGLWLWRRKSVNKGPAGATPGGGKRFSTKVLDLGAMLLQGKSPLAAIDLYLDRFQFFADDMSRQVNTHNYCSRINEDVVQCIVYDGNTRNARLVGVGYIISERLFNSLPEDERRLWHSMGYEVKSGQVFPAGIIPRMERSLLERLGNSYGKMWHVWDTANNDLPVGIPSLMMSFTGDGQIRAELLQERDERCGITTQELVENRRDIYTGPVSRGADAWQSGRTPQLQREERDVKRESGEPVGSAG